MESLYNYTFLQLHSMVCHLSVCRLSNHPPWLTHLTDLDAGMVYLWASMTHYVRWGPWPPRGRGDLGINPQQAKDAITSNDEQFRLLQNYFGPCYYYYYARQQELL